MEETMLRFARGFSAMAAFVLALAGPAAAQNADWDKIVEAAKKEGTVSLYTSTLGAPFHRDIIKAFTAKYGITIELLDVRASELDERIRTEQASQRYNCDVVQHGSASLLNTYDRPGLLQSRGDVPNQKNLREGFAEATTNTRMPAYVLPYGILVNTDLVKPADEPKSWKDLTDPKWKGKILSDDFRALGGGSVLFAVTDDKFGTEFHEKLSQQGLIFSREVGTDERRVAAGEYPLRIPQLASNYLRMKGLPVKLIIPEEGASFVRFEFGILKGAPHPNAAKLLIDFYLSPEAQIIYANAGMGPVINGVAEKANPEARAVAGAKLMGTNVPDKLNAQLDKAKQMYK
jgi:iron(III) transport system substrate-binding protein